MVHKKLMAARMSLQEATLKKSGHNKFAGYNYFELGDFIPTITEIFYNIGLCGVVSYDSEIASLTITDTDDGTSLVITSPMAEANRKGCHPIQNLGAVETYQRRYLWMTAMEIVENDVIDASPQKEPAKVEPVKVEPKVVPPKHIKGDVLPPQYVDKDPGWTIHITGEGEPYKKVLTEATKLKLFFAKNDEDVRKMFQINRKLYDAAKAEDPAFYEELLELFTETKKKFTQD